MAERSMLLEAAAVAAGAQAYPAGTLYVVATPIGNLADITLRAVHVLGLVDAIACEDTRHSGALLARLGIAAPKLFAAHAHNEHEAAAAVVERLRRGERVALVSDAGTPAISDPGARVVRAVREAGFAVVPVPGASSALAAIAVAGDDAAEAYVVRGFAAARGAERARAVEQAAASSDAQVLFEAPHRIESLLGALAAAAPARTLTICRELTKQFETIATLPCADAPAWLAADPNRSRGEFVLVLHARPRISEAAADRDADADIDRTLSLLLAELPLKQAVALAAAITRAPRNRLYDLALARQKRDNET